MPRSTTLPGAYRGGEGDDPARFRRLNLDGTRRALRCSRGPARIVFLSSRAVYGDHRRGEILRETDPPAPDSLYGEVKLAAEGARRPRHALRATGVYGGSPHKWAGLFAAYLRGEPVPPRLATEVHGADLAAAVLARSSTGPTTGAFNVSDLLLDRHDLLARVQALTGCPHPPPPRAAGPPPGIMATARLRALGWRPGGWERLDAFLGEEFKIRSYWLKGPEGPCEGFRPVPTCTKYQVFVFAEVTENAPNLTTDLSIRNLLLRRDRSLRQSFCRSRSSERRAVCNVVTTSGLSRNIHDLYQPPDLLTREGFP